MSEHERVVVTGYGLFTPLGCSAEKNWSSILQSKSGIQKITQFDASQFSSQIAGEIDYDPKNFFPQEEWPELRKMERFTQFFLLASREALFQSGIDVYKKTKEEREVNLREVVAPERIGVSIGVGLGGLQEIENQHSVFLEKGPRKMSPFFIPRVIGNIAAGQLAILHKIKGPNICISTACSSSSHAIGEAFRMLQRREVDMMVAGGAESVICPLGIGGFCSLRALSTRNDAPDKASRPFDKERDGFIMGEGSGALVLETLSHAKKRGALIYAELVGYGRNDDAFHITQPSPDGEGAKECIELCLTNAELRREQIDYINAHGTSTPVGDIEELKAIKRVFKDHAENILISSTKSMTGHLLGATGAVEAVYTVMSICKKIAPPTINLDEPDDEVKDLDLVAHVPKEKKIQYALSNSFGFGGTNACLAFGAWK